MISEISPMRKWKSADAVKATAKCTGQTGVDMEAMTAVNELF